MDARVFPIVLKNVKPRDDFVVAHKSNSLNPELKCRLSFLLGCIRSR